MKWKYVHLNKYYNKLKVLEQCKIKEVIELEQKYEKEKDALEKKHRGHEKEMKKFQVEETLEIIDRIPKETRHSKLYLELKKGEDALRKQEKYD